MKQLFLSIDFGSTYTKLNLFDLEEATLLAQAQAHTTIHSSILEGFYSAFSRLQKLYPITLEEITEIKICSSAAGGLRTIVIGLVPKLTLEAAKQAALGAGSKILSSYSFFLQAEQVKEIEESKADMILLSGGSNGGNEEIPLYNAEKLANSSITCPILYCGNESIQKKIQSILESKGKICHLAQNIMPDVNQMSVDDCREKIRSIFFENIVEAKGLQEVKELFSVPILPTPSAVLQCLECLEDSYPSSMLIDIGGATTDVHSLCETKIYEKKCFLEGLVEPKAKRSVEGDLGMRYSALSVAEQVEAPPFLSRDAWLTKANFLGEMPDFLSESEEDKQIDLALAKACAKLSSQRHCGTMRPSYTVSEKIVLQQGKDFRFISHLIGTGGILVHSSAPKEILSAMLQEEEDTFFLKPRTPELLLDRKYIAAALGLLGKERKDLIQNLAKKYFEKI